MDVIEKNVMKLFSVWLILLKIIRTPPAQRRKIRYILKRLYKINIASLDPERSALALH